MKLWCSAILSLGVGLACSDRGAETRLQADEQSETASAESLSAGTESDWLPKKPEEGPPYFCWRLQKPGNGLRFLAGPVDVARAPLIDSKTATEDWYIEKVDSVWLEDGSLLVRVGPVGFWCSNETLYLILDKRPEGWRIQVAGVWHADDIEGMEWITLLGTITIDSDSSDPRSSIRCDAELWDPEIEYKRGVFRRTFSHTPSTSSVELLKELKDFEGVPPVRD